jgi:uncharacterized protein
MDITPLTPQGRQIINRYGNGRFVISEKEYTGNLLVTPEHILPWSAENLNTATFESFSALFTQAVMPEIILIGAGSQFLPMPADLRNYFRKRNIAIDAMDTGAACRTFNVLLGEDRRVAAALIAV